MYDRVIVAAREKPQVESWKMIGRLAMDELGVAARVVSCRDAEQCEELRNDDPDSKDLLIIEIALPASADAIAVPGGSGGEDLVTKLQGRPLPPACILVGCYDDRLIAKIGQMPRCKLLGASSDLLPNVVGLARRLGADAPRTAEIDAERAWALLEVFLAGPMTSFFRLFTGRGDVASEPILRSCELSSLQIELIIEKSRKLSRDFSNNIADPACWQNYSREWQKHYASLGADVYRLISQDTFHELWGRARQAAEGSARIRFTLGRHVYDGLWESAYNEKQESWLMLDGGITRRAHLTNPTPLNLRPLDGGDGVVNVLAIFSDIAPGSKLVGPDDAVWQGLVNGLSLNAQERLGRRPKTQDLFPTLANLDDERDMLLKLDVENGQRLDVDHISSKDIGSTETLLGNVREKIKKTLSPGRSCHYDVVHFAGHALFSEESDQRGYLMFGDAKMTEAVPIAVFADLLRQAGVQLAYLNCCKSSASRAAFDLANNRVPLAIGFAWDLETSKAIAFAEAFYRHLLESELKVCHAFHLARTELHSIHQEGDPIWTAPVLVAQPEQWGNVETCFARA